MALENKSPNTILLDVGSDSKLLEATCGEEGVLPGSLLEYAATGALVNAIPGAIDLQLPLMVATENTAEGLGVDDPYSIGEKLYAVHLRPGDLFLGRISAASTYIFSVPMGTSTVIGRFSSATSINVAIAFMGETITSGTGNFLGKMIAK